MKRKEAKARFETRLQENLNEKLEDFKTDPDKVFSDTLERAKQFRKRKEAEKKNNAASAAETIPSTSK